MSSHANPNALTFKAGSTGIVKGCVVKPGADNKHVLISAAATSKNLGLALGAASAAEDKVEVALPGGGAKGLLGGTVSFGDLLTSDASGNCVATTTPGDRYVAMAMEDGVAGDLISVHVITGLI
jgi:hypothetical protein